MNEKLQISIDGGKAYAHSFSKIVKTPADGSEEERYLFTSSQEALSQQLFTPRSGWFSPAFGNVVSFLHFSDIHGDGICLARVVDFLKTLPASVVPLFTGDMVYNSWSNGIDFWNEVQGTGKILVAIGNHDNSGAPSPAAASCYSRYLEPNIASWGVTYTPGVCYYYKDFATQGLRLVVLDCMNWDSTQQSWLVSVLNDAKTNGYHVVIANHYAPANMGTATENRTCSFDTIGYNTSDAISSQAAAAVQNFIDAGGYFVAWMCGHTHADMLRFPTSYPKQLYYAVANASMEIHVGGSAGCLLERIDGKKSQDLFNLVTIHPGRKLMSIVRVGVDYDTLGRHMGSLVYDYASNQIIWND